MPNPVPKPPSTPHPSTPTSTAFSISKKSGGIPPLYFLPPRGNVLLPQKRDFIWIKGLDQRGFVWKLPFLPTNTYMLYNVLCSSLNIYTSVPYHRSYSSILKEHLRVLMQCIQAKQQPKVIFKVTVICN